MTPLPFPPTEEDRPSTSIRRLSVSIIQDLVPGGVLRAHKRNYGDSYTGWWLGIDDDGVPKLDITFDDDTYIRFDDSGISIGGDGAAITNIDGASIQTGTITAEKLNVSTLSAVATNTGSLTVSSTLTMGAAGQITWQSGGCRITDDYIDMDISASDLYALRFLASSTVYAYLAAMQTTNLTQVSIKATGPAATKVGRIALSAVEYLGADPEPATVGMLMDSSLGVEFAPLAYSAGCTFTITDMDAVITKKLSLTGAGTDAVAIDVASSRIKTTQTDITEVYLDRYGILLKNIYTGSGWARTFLRYTDDDEVMYFGIGGAGSGQTCNSTWWGCAYDDTWIKCYLTGTQAIFINYDAKDYDFCVKGATRSAALYVQASDGYVGINVSTPTVSLDVNDDSMRIRTAKTPASAGAAGLAGQICWSSGYIYVCTATNTWKRAALTTW